MKDSMVFKKQWRDGFKVLTPQEQAEAFNAILDYGLDGVPYSGDNRAIGLLMAMITPQIDKNNQAYNDICDKRKDAADKRWQDAKASKSIHEDAKASKSIHEDAKASKRMHDIDSDIDSDSDNDNDNDNKEKNIPLSGDIPKESRTAFRPPMLDEVINYCREKGYMWDPEYFYDYYTSNGWMVGRTKMKDWRAAMRNWNKKESQQQQKKEYGVYIKRREDSRRETPVADWKNLTPEDMQFRVR